MSSPGHDLLDYFEEDRDQLDANTPSVDNLFSNRDVLERRLRCRLDREDLVVRGILPANHAAPNILAQIQQLERAKTGDILQRKIRVRSSRQQLVQRHILADSKIDASLQGKQTSLERHRIADSLNEQLFNRPGPLELIRENILKVEPNFADAVKQGCVQFNPTCRDVSTSPLNNINIDSPLSEVDGSRCSLDSLSPLGQDSMDTFSQAFSDHVKVDNINATSSDCLLGSNSVSNAMSELEDCIISTTEASSRESGRFDRTKESSIRKQSKSNKKKLLNQNKQKVKKYKYHEYKPPGAVPATYQAPLDDRYKRLLEQQQMFLQLQVMKQNALFAAISGSPEQPAENQMELEEKPIIQGEGTGMPASLPAPILSKSSVLDDLRVTELRSALRMRGLPVSGSKSKLLERLKAYEDKQREDCREKSVDACTSVPCTPTKDETSQPLNNAVSPNSCANTFIKVTTYASQNGETFQLVQAVPNLPTSDIQYHLMPSSVVLPTAQPAIQPFPIQHFGIQTTPQTAHVVQVPASEKVDDSLLSKIATSVPRNVRETLPLIAGQSLNQSVSQATHPNHSVIQAVHPSQHDHTLLSQQSVNSVAGAPNLGILSAMEQNQQAVIDPLALQMLSTQIQQVAKLHSSVQSDSILRAKEAEHNTNLLLLRQLQQLKQQNLSKSDQSNFQDNSVAQDSSAENGHQHILPVYQWDTSNDTPGKDQLFAQTSLCKDDNANFRSRSQTDPLRDLDSGFPISTKSSFSPLAGTLHSSHSFQDSNQHSSLFSKWSGKESHAVSLPSGIPELSIKNEPRASDDLMDILGELSSSASTEVVNISGHGSRSALMPENHRTHQRDLQNDMQVKERSVLTAASVQTQSSPPSTFTSHRPYGSFPGHLNALGVALSDSAIHNSVRDISNKNSCTAKSSQDLQLNPVHIGDIEMDSEAPFFSHSNDLEWLNLTSFQNIHSYADKEATKVQNEASNEMSMDVLPANLFENAKSQDPLSIFDIDGAAHSLMVVDSGDPEKWDF